MNALAYVDIDQGIHKGKVKLLKMKRKKLLGFSFYINIAFGWTFSSSANLLLLKSVLLNTCILISSTNSKIIIHISFALTSSTVIDKIYDL